MLLNDRRGGTTLEYAPIAGIVVATVLIGFTSLSNVASNQLSSIGNSIR